MMTDAPCKPREVPEQLPASGRAVAPGTVWPTVIGVLSIVLGASRFLAAGRGRVFQIWQMIQNMLSGAGAGLGPGLSVPLGIQALQPMALLALIAGGIVLLCRRRATGRRRHTPLALGRGRSATKFRGRMEVAVARCGECHRSIHVCPGPSPSQSGRRRGYATGIHSLLLRHRPAMRVAGF